MYKHVKESGRLVQGNGHFFLRTEALAAHISILIEGDAMRDNGQYVRPHG